MNRAGLTRRFPSAGVWAAIMLAALAAACGGVSTAPAQTPSSQSTSTEGAAPLSSQVGSPPAVADAAGIVLVKDQSVLVQEGGQRREVAHVQGDGLRATYPTWSPDGHRIAFVQAAATIEFVGDWGDDIYVMNADGSDLQLLRRHTAPGTQIQGLAWTPNGSALVIGVRETDIVDNRITGFALRIERFDLQSGTTTLLVDNAISPTVSRSSNRLAFVRIERGAATLWIAGLDGSDPKPVPLQGRLIIFEPRLAPDGQSVVLGSESIASSARPPTSPSGLLARALRFLGVRTVDAHGVAMEVYRVDLDSGDVRALTNMQLDDPVTTWSADGARLYTIATSGLYRMGADGTDLVQQGEGIFSGQIDVH